VIKIATTSKKTTTKVKTNVKIKDPDIYTTEENPPDFDGKFNLVVIREAFLHRIAEVFSKMDRQGLEFVTQINCFSKDIHLIFKKKKGK